MKHSKVLLEEMCTECDQYCFAKEFLTLSSMSDYMLTQLKMIEKFKYSWSEESGYDIGWEEATKRYTNLYGKKFSELWERDGAEGRHITKLYWGLQNEQK